MVVGKYFNDVDMDDGDGRKRCNHIPVTELQTQLNG